MEKLNKRKMEIILVTHKLKEIQFWEKDPNQKMVLHTKEISKKKDFKINEYF